MEWPCIGPDSRFFARGFSANKFISASFVSACITIARDYHGCVSPSCSFETDELDQKLKLVRRGGALGGGAAVRRLIPSSA